MRVLAWPDDAGHTRPIRWYLACWSHASYAAKFISRASARYVYPAGRRSLMDVEGDARKAVDDSVGSTTGGKSRSRQAESLRSRPGFGLSRQRDGHLMRLK